MKRRSFLNISAFFSVFMFIPMRLLSYVKVWYFRDNLIHGFDDEKPFETVGKYGKFLAFTKGKQRNKCALKYLKALEEL